MITITNNITDQWQETWRRANPGSINIDFQATEDDIISIIQLKVCSNPQQVGVILDWTTIIQFPISEGIKRYLTDWEIPENIWQRLIEGTNYISIRVHDGKNWTEFIDIFYIKKDTRPPVTTSNVPSDWVATNQTITLTATDSGVGVDKIYYYLGDSLDVIPNIEYKEPINVTCGKNQKVNKYLRYFSVDLLGNTEEIKTDNIRIDKQNPNSSITKPEDGRFYNSLPVIEGTCTDYNGSGVEKIEVEIKNVTANLYWDGNSWRNDPVWIEAILDTKKEKWNYSFTAELITSVQYQVRSRATDKLNHVESEPAVSYFYFDDIPPTIQNNQFTDIWRNKNNGEYNVTFEDTGESKLSYFQACLYTEEDHTGEKLQDWTTVVDNINSDSYNKKWKLPDSIWNAAKEGENWVSVRVFDNAGNYTVLKDVFNVLKDTKPPSCNAGPDIADKEQKYFVTDKFTRVGRGKDKTSGIKELKWSVVSKPKNANVIFRPESQQFSEEIKSEIIPDTIGEYIIRLTAEDIAGNKRNNNFKFLYVSKVEDTTELSREAPQEPPEERKEIDRVALEQLRSDLRFPKPTETTALDDLLVLIDEILKETDEIIARLDEMLKDTYLDLDDLDEDDRIALLDALRELEEIPRHQVSLPQVSFSQYNDLKKEQRKRKAVKAQCRGNVELLEGTIIPVPPSPKKVAGTPEETTTKEPEYSEFQLQMRRDYNVDVVVNTFEKAAEENIIRSNRPKLKGLIYDIEDSVRIQWKAIAEDLSAEWNGIKKQIKEQIAGGDYIVNDGIIYATPDVELIKTEIEEMKKIEPKQILGYDVNQLLGRRWLDGYLTKKFTKTSKELGELQTKIDSINEARKFLLSFQNDYNNLMGEYNKNLSERESLSKKIRDGIATEEEVLRHKQLMSEGMGLRDSIIASKNNLDYYKSEFGKAKSTPGSYTAYLFDRVKNEKDFLKKMKYNIMSTIMDNLNYGICCLIKTIVFDKFEKWAEKKKWKQQEAEFDKKLDEIIKDIDKAVKYCNYAIFILNFLFKTNTYESKNVFKVLQNVLNPIAEGIMCSILMTYKTISKRIIDNVKKELEVRMVRYYDKKTGKYGKCFPVTKLTSFIIEALEEMDRKVVENFLTLVKTQTIRFKMRNKKSFQLAKWRNVGQYINVLNLIATNGEYWKQTIENVRNVDSYAEAEDLIHKAINFVLQQAGYTTTYNKATDKVEPLGDIMSYCRGIPPTIDQVAATAKLTRDAPYEGDEKSLYVDSIQNFRVGDEIEISDGLKSEIKIIDRVNKIPNDEKFRKERILNKIVLTEKLENSYNIGASVVKRS